MTIISRLHNIKQKKILLTWISFHLIIFLFFIFNLIFSKTSYSVSADLFNMLPKTFSEESVNKADAMLTSGANNNVFILVSNKDFSEAKKIAEYVYSKLEKSEYFSSISLYNDENSVDQVIEFIFNNKWNLIDNNTIKLIENQGLSYISDMALSLVYGGITLTSLDNLEEDPFLLSELELKNYLEKIQQSGIGMTAVDGVLAQETENGWYIMLRGVLNKEGAAMASKKNGVTEIYKVCAEFESDETHFVFSGTPFHSHESSNSASKEIVLISIISLLLMLVILLIVFRSPIPILCSISAILLSALTAFIGTLSIFKTVHIIALVFGTSLIGSCIDYSLHYFVHWASNSELTNGIDIRNYVLKGLSLAIISSCVCFSILLFAPFTLLKQISIFCLLGLISSYLTTIAIYPYIKLPKDEKRKFSFEGIFRKNNSDTVRTLKKIIPITLIFFSLMIICIFHNQIGVKNNISSLYKMKGKLLSDEIESAKVIQYNPTGWFILRAETEQELIEKEELFTEKYKNLKNNTGYICTSLFIPSIKSQKLSRTMSKKLLENIDEQLFLLGYDTESSSISKQSFNESELNYITVSNCPDIISNVIQNCWIGNLNGKYYSVFIPSKINDEKELKTLVLDNDIFFVNKSTDISTDLDKLSYLILIFFGFSLFVIFAITKMVYTWKESLKVISVPIFILLMIFAIFGLLNIKLEFFSITGVVLVFGLGLDYIIYMIENNHKDVSIGKKLEPFATLLSFITTIISFGSLALSSFQPIHLIGLSICIGLTTAYICSLTK